MKIKISICIPTWNSASYLKEAILSATNQSYENIEILVVDNCSTDNTKGLVEDLQKNDERIIYKKNDTNIGLFGNLNRCLEHASGEYIKFLCSDDLLHPNCIELMVPHLAKDKNIQLVTGGRLRFDIDEGIKSIARFSSVKETVAGDVVIHKCLFGRNYIGEPTAVLFRADTAKRGFRKDLEQLADIEMWFHLLEKGTILNIPEPVCFIREHNEQFTKSNIKSGVFFEDYNNLFELYKNKEYLAYTKRDLIKRKLIVSLYLWRSRKIITKELKLKVIKNNSHYFYYLLMPVISSFLSIIGKCKYHIWKNKTGFNKSLIPLDV